VKLSTLSATCMLLAGLGGSIAMPAQAQMTSIVVQSAVFGPPKDARPYDFTGKLAETCGPGASYCQAFCTRAAVGQDAVRKPILLPPPRSLCRVSYRCGALLTRVAEADENDTFTLSCRPRP
jgi:hypothetical protein